MTFLQKTAIELLTRHVKDDQSAEAVINEHLSIFLNDCSPIFSIDTRQPCPVPGFSRSESVFSRIDEPISPLDRSGEFRLRHFSDPPPVAELLARDPGYRYASFEESAAFHFRHSLVSYYFRIVVLGSTWQRLDDERVVAHVEWHRDQAILTTETRMTEDRLLLLARN